VLPSNVPVVATNALVQEPGRGPHISVLLLAIRRVRDAIPEGHSDGSVPVRELNATFSCFRPVMVLQEEGSEEATALLSTRNRVSDVNVDQPEGSVPVKALLAKDKVSSVSTQLSWAGRVPDKLKELMSSPVTCPLRQVM